MKRLFIIVSVLAVVIFGFTTASAGASSSKLVGHPPSKRALVSTTTAPEPPSTSITTTSTTTTSTTVPTTTRTIWPPPDDPPVTWPVPVTTRIVGTSDIPPAPFHLRYSMRTDHNLELRWEWIGKSYPLKVGYSVCFYADGHSLCDGDPSYYRNEADYVVIVLPRYFAAGVLPQCLILSVQLRFDDNQNSTITSAPPVCQGTYR